MSDNEDNTLIIPKVEDLDADAPEPRIVPKTGPLGKEVSLASVGDLLNYRRSDGFPTGDFTLVPASLADKAYEPGTVRWWLELWLDDKGAQRLRYEIVGDVTIGRSNDVDIDLQNHSGLEHGVSRQHAMLRPSKKGLYLLDLGSTNGTQYNGIPISKGAVPVVENAVIRLGTLNLTIHFLALTEV